MEIHIVERRENKLLDREEIFVIIEHRNKATPRRDELRKNISVMLNVDENLVIVKKILSFYNQQKSKAWICIYKNKESLLKIEPRYILKRNKIIQ